MWGAVIGDIVGSRFEGTRIKTKEFELLTRDCRYTDDTVCTAAVAASLLDGLPPDLTLRAWCHRHPGRGYGGMFARWLEREAPQSYGSFAGRPPYLSSMASSPMRRNSSGADSTPFLVTTMTATARLSMRGVGGYTTGRFGRDGGEAQRQRAERPGTGSPSSRTEDPLRVLSQLAGRSDITIKRDRLHPELRREIGDGRVAAPHCRLRKANLRFGERELPPSPSTPSAGCRETSDRALANELAFKLGERREDAENEPTRWSGGVDLRALPRQDPKSDLAVRELLHDVHEVAEVTSEAIELPDDERIFRAKRLEAPVEPGTAVTLSGSLVLVDRPRRDARGNERIALEVEALGAIGLRDACVANQHVS